MTVLFLILLVGAGLTTVSARRICIDQDCYSRTNVTYDDYLLPENRTSLTAYCNFNQRIYDCLLGSTKRCNDSVPIYPYEAESELLKKICRNDTNLGTRFLRHTSCFNNHARDIFENATFQDIIANITDPEKQCRLVLNSQEILYQNIQKYCGYNATSVFKELLSASGDYMKELCGDKKTTKEESVVTTEPPNEPGSLDAQIKLRAKLPSLRWLVKAHSNISIKGY